jgi:putative phosphoribosyl transferase
MPDSNEQPIQIPMGSVSLSGDLTVPDRAQGVVLFAHGSGSGRYSPRNRYIRYQDDDKELKSHGYVTEHGA